MAGEVPTRMMARACVALALGLGLASATVGCRSDVPEPPDVITSVAALMDTVRQYEASGPLSGILVARASQYSNRGGIKGKLEMVVARPGHLRFAALTPTDDEVSVLVTDGLRFSAFERGQKVCHVGNACATNVGRFTGVPMQADELAGVMLGRPPILPHADGHLGWDRGIGAYRVELIGDAAKLGLAHGQTQRLWVAHGDGRILRAQIETDGRVQVDVRYSEFKTIKGKVLPGRIDVTMARDDTDLRIELREIDLETPVNKEVFEHGCPDGATLDELPCY